MRHIDYRDLIGGLILIGIGVFVALYASSHYTVGEPARMGPGFFPTALGWILAILGVIIALLAFRKGVHAIEPPPWRPRALAAVLLAILAFAFLVESTGLVPATFVLVFIASFADRNFSLKRTVLLGISLAVIAWLIFTVGLQMQLPAFAFLE